MKPTSCPYLAFGKHVELTRSTKPSDHEIQSLMRLAGALVSSEFNQPLGIPSIGYMTDALMSLNQAAPQNENLLAVWEAWLERTKPWLQEHTYNGRVINHGWQLAERLVGKKEAVWLERLLASPGAPDAQALTSTRCSVHSYLVKTKDDPEGSLLRHGLPEDWKGHYSLLGRLVSESNWNWGHWSRGVGRDGSPNAAEASQVQKIQQTLAVLLNKGVDPNVPVADGGLRALSLAGHPGVVRALVEQGADPFATNREGALACAAYWHQVFPSRDLLPLVNVWETLPSVEWNQERWGLWARAVTSSIATLPRNPAKGLNEVMEAVIGLARRHGVDPWAEADRPLAFEVAKALVVGAQGEEAKGFLNREGNPSAWLHGRSKTPSPAAAWALVAKTLSLSDQHPDCLATSLTQPFQEGLLGNSRATAVQHLPDAFGELTTHPVGVFQAWTALLCLSSSLQVFYKERLFDQLVQASLACWATASEKDMLEANKKWNDKAFRDVRGVLSDWLNPNRRRGPGLGLESQVVLNALAGHRQSLETTLAKLEAEEISPVLIQVLLSAPKVFPQTWATVNIEPLALSKKLNQTWPEAASKQPRVRL